jgi:hypothetical protein
MRMKRRIRLDDFPWGDWAGCARACGYIFDTFNRYSVPFILGVVPMLLDVAAVDFLRQRLPPHGVAVMHGFSHLYATHTPAQREETWPQGGEFAGMDVATVERNWRAADVILSQGCGALYDPTIFIAPFNTYTQAALDAFSRVGVRELHTCDKEWDAYGYAALDHHGITPVVSRWGKTYSCDLRGKSDMVTLEAHLADPSQITMHWVYDVRRPHWREEYERIANKVSSMEANA